MSKYTQIAIVNYKNGYFEAGTVTGSKHKENTVYLDVNGIIHELTDDEALAIINIMSGALWRKLAGE